MNDDKHKENLNMYFLFIEKIGYKILMNLTNYISDEKQKENPDIRTIKLFCSNIKNGIEYFYFYEVTDNSIYSLNSFLEYMKTKEKQNEFINGVHMRMVPFDKSEVLIGILSNGHKIDDVYKDKNLVLNHQMIEELFNWANFKGGSKVQHRR